ncbi:MAG: hypothetical protein ACI4UE_00850 [Candidatus Scatovivens sp.]
MKKIIIMFLTLVSMTVISYSKYIQKYELEAIEIATDIEAPTYTINYSTKEFTNCDVEITIIFSEEIKQIEGFKKINNLTYKKILKENKTEKINVFDLAGNKTEIEYSVTWIDKIPPEIIGINNDETYNNVKTVNYSDNFSGIKNIEKVFYGDLEIGISNFITKEDYYEITIKILRMPKNCNQYKFCKINEGIKQISNSDNNLITYRIPINENFEIYAEAIDINNKSYISEKININNIDKFIEKNKKYSNEDLYIFSNPGYYDIKVTDNANNEIFYTIKIEK